MTDRVLIVEDEIEIASILREYLEREGLEVRVCGRVADARRALQTDPPNVMLLDITLPDGSGLDVLRTAGSGTGVPTILLTARGSESDRIVGLELGADDYITKPFSPREVVARVRSVLRRVNRSADAPDPKQPLARVGALEVDRRFHEVRIDGRPVKLTATEFRILDILIEHPGEVFSRARLLDRLNDVGDIYERTLDRHINNLRQKVEPEPHRPQYVLTVHGIGYKLRRADS